MVKYMRLLKLEMKKKISIKKKTDKYSITYTQSQKVAPNFKL